MRQLQARDLSIETVGSMRKIDRDEWDRLAKDIYMSHGWLQVIEEAFLDPVDHRYFLARADGQLVGAAVVHIQPPSRDVFTLDDAVFGRLKHLASGLGLSVLPSMICGPLRTYGQHLVYDDHFKPEERAIIATTLLDAMEEEAEQHRVSISFNNVMAREKELMELLSSRGFSKTVNFPLNYLDVRWKTTEDYRKFLAKQKLTREINKNRREGVEIKTTDSVEGCSERLHALLNENYMKYNGKPLPVKKSFIGLCKQHLGPEAVVYVAEKKGKIVGATVMFHQNGVAYLTDVGVDHAATGNDFTYFNISYYRPISDAIEMGLKRIYYGTMMYSMKAQRGCSTTDIFLFHRPRKRLLRRLFVPLFAAHRAFKSRFIRRHYF
jgi:predicted N-acyltransferase